MRHHRMVSALGALALGVSGLAATASATAAPAADVNASSSGAAENYGVLADKGGSAADLAEQLKVKGAKVTHVNDEVGMVTVTSTDAGFAAQARSMKGVFGAAAEGVVGRSPQRAAKKNAEGDAKKELERPRLQGKGHGKGHVKGQGSGHKSPNPLDDKLWGMDMINASAAQKITSGSRMLPASLRSSCPGTATTAGTRALV